jgi:hypothetical protein
MGTPRFVLYNDIRIRTVNKLGGLGGATDATTATKTNSLTRRPLGPGQARVLLHPVRAFPSSAFLDKNKGDIGKSQACGPHPRWKRPAHCRARCAVRSCV